MKVTITVTLLQDYTVIDIEEYIQLVTRYGLHLIQ